LSPKRPNVFFESEATELPLSPKCLLLVTGKFRTTESSNSSIARRCLIAGDKSTARGVLFFRVYIRVISHGIGGDGLCQISRVHHRPESITQVFDEHLGIGTPITPFWLPMLITTKVKFDISPGTLAEYLRTGKFLQASACYYTYWLDHLFGISLANSLLQCPTGPNNEKRP